MSMNTITIIILVMIVITSIAHIFYIHYRKVKQRKKITTARLLRVIQLTLKSHGYYNQIELIPREKNDSNKRNRKGNNDCLNGDRLLQIYK